MRAFCIYILYQLKNQTKETSEPVDEKMSNLFRCKCLILVWNIILWKRIILVLKLETAASQIFSNKIVLTPPWPKMLTRSINIWSVRWSKMDSYPPINQGSNCSPLISLWFEHGSTLKNNIKCKLFSFILFLKWVVCV